MSLSDADSSIDSVSETQSCSVVDSDSDLDEAIVFTPPPIAKRTKRQPPIDETSGENFIQQFMSVKKITPLLRQAMS